MRIRNPSPYAKPVSGLRIIEGAPSISRPSKEEIASFPRQAKELIDSTWAVQSSLLRARKYDVNWLKDKHIILAGATGPGLGGALSTAVLNLLGDTGSLTVVSRDLTRSLGFETALYMLTKAEGRNVHGQFYWINDGLALEGKAFEKITAFLKKVDAKQIIYINTVASASSGLLPDHPPVYVKDVDQEGLFQWQLSPLSPRNIETTKYYMGTLAVDFQKALENAGFEVSATSFADWRGSLDRCSRNPKLPEYGRHGPYSTSLFLPKDTIQEATSNAYKSDKIVLDFFFPVMNTRSLHYIPGGKLMFMVYDELRNREGLPFIDIPELALAMLDRIGKALSQGVENPFPRLDMLEASLELWFYEVMSRLTNDRKSEFYYKNWISSELLD